MQKKAFVKLNVHALVKNINKLGIGDRNNLIKCYKNLDQMLFLMIMLKAFHTTTQLYNYSTL